MLTLNMGVGFSIKGRNTNKIQQQENEAVKPLFLYMSLYSSVKGA